VLTKVFGPLEGQCPALPEYGTGPSIEVVKKSKAVFTAAGETYAADHLE